MAKIYATGRRKASIAKVWLTPGTGNMTINGLSLDAWLGGLEAKKLRVKQPLALTKQDTSVDIVATTLGGGFGGQADALRHGISRALVAFNPALKAILKPEGMMTRDSRIVERKKPGKRKARRSRQFSKR
ncbi:MAG: 30S ribosomal protein S9 [Sulfurimonas sp.]|jgi:small subunit ribosomal protein S9|uniref:30S ribosomal protein S9 n=1 Tax=unclassified Sulfurimonas TaxID=2623549 RepID=UPI0008B5D450|nr:MULTISPECIES: 30S ribosomal protein S9 [unclassified Sulfurimonas]OHD96327.1 MAG: 30S ribosomal protein S9 [Sulfurimonas sp. RIFCSPHIGHO2_12_FULL_36_9]OHD97079.1 MAG: 30S ribosomal protein S9 [Sulfurimonas sp. RIFCSPLOWO2_02_FULL_36_28]OHE00249.1 MAG: 30S ribosomal protein S9 [Sulfurimonas sp. RIFCSPLOWO2_12_36_12]OHE07974.1 MAG: 30S ribosomal protein S9 [Sulfurimonas sp. RIFCSPLOWO2_12_FULL_36_74]